MHTKSIKSTIDSRDSRFYKHSTLDTSIVDKENSGYAKVSFDTRVRGLHTYLTEQFNDTTYGIGHTYTVAKKLTDYEIVSVAEYCKRKANNPVAAFIAICEKKIAV